MSETLDSPAATESPESAKVVYFSPAPPAPLLSSPAVAKTVGDDDSVAEVISTPMAKDRDDDIRAQIDELRRGALAQLSQIERLAISLSSPPTRTPSQNALANAVAARGGEARGGNAAAETAEYVSRTPFNTTRKMTLDYLRAATHPVGPTEIVKNTEKTGIPLSYTAVRRALDALVDNGLAEKVDDNRWAATEISRRGM